MSFRTLLLHNERWAGASFGCGVSLAEAAGPGLFRDQLTRRGGSTADG